MSTETAQTILTAIAIPAGFIWLIGLWFLCGSYRAVKGHRDQTDLDQPGPVPANWFAGSVEVEGQPSALLDKAASLLVKKTNGMLEIVERKPDRFAFRRVGPRMTGLPEQGEIQFSSAGGSRTRIDYAVEVMNYQWLLKLGGIFQAAGLVALVGGAWSIYTFCVSSPSPALRGQALQMLQIIHFLWPPFLFGALYRNKRRAMASQFGAFLRNLPQLAE